MRRSTGLRLVGLITPPLILLISFACLVVLLDRIASSLLNSNTSRSFGGQKLSLSLPSNSTSNSTTDVSVDINTNIAPTAAILGVAVFSGFVGILAGCGIWELRRVEGSPRYQRMWAWLNFVFSAIAIGVCVGVLAWASALQRSEEGWSSLADVGKGDPEFTRETWTCQIHEFFPSEGWAGSACGLSKATRFMLIPVAIAAALTILTTWILTYERGGVKWLIGGRGRYGAFDSIYEMNASGPTPSPGPMPYGQPIHYGQPIPYGQAIPYGQPMPYGQSGQYFQQGPQYQPGPQYPPPQLQQSQAPPLAQKVASTAGAQPVFR